MSVLSRVNSMVATILINPNRGLQHTVSHPNFSFLHSPTFRSFSLYSSPTSSDICQVAQATKSEVDVLLKGVGDRSLVEEIKHILDMANRASLRREVQHTDFLTPPVLNEAMVALKKLSDINAIPNGGYPEAERCRLSVGHPDVLKTVPNSVAALRITGNFGYQPPSHGDFLGSILGTGIAREKLGDIFLQGENGAQVLIVPELVDYMISSLDKVGKVPVSCTLIPLEELEYQPPSTKMLKTVESSLRVDAIASAGFKISRSKFADLIRASLKTGDMVSVSGSGRLKVGEIHTTKKGKYAVELIRYI